MLRKPITILLAASALVATLGSTVSPAQAQWRRHNHYYGPGPGAIVGGALLGLGVGTLLARPYYAPPPVVYAPPPAYYAPPAYAYAPPPYAYAPAYAPTPYYYRPY